MTWSDHAGLSGDLPASAPVSGRRTGPGRVPEHSAGRLAAIDGQARIRQLLEDAVNLLLKAGLQLASVNCRLNEADEQQAVEQVTGQLDAALVEIRRLSVRVALSAKAQENGKNGARHTWP